MKTKTIFATLAAVAAVSGVIGNFAQMKTATTNASVLANVEALTSGDDAPVKYFVFHMPVFDKNGNTTLPLPGGVAPGPAGPVRPA